MQRCRRYVPTRADRLEDRLALSHGTIHRAAPLVHPHGHAAAPAAAIALSGTIAGATPLVGSGTVSPLGAVTGTGRLTARGGEPVTYTGTVTLVGADGSLTASLFGRPVGPEHPGEPVALTYTITGGTGAFAGATGRGPATYTPTGGFSVTFGD
jgi:hypothetical protein